MKCFTKILFSLLFLIITEFSLFAQYEFCITGGANYTGLSGPEKPNSFNREFAYKGGMYLISKFSGKGAFLFELDYVQRRFSFTEKIYSLEEGIITVEEKNSYIALPLQIRFSKGDHTIQGFINGGFEFSLLLFNKRDTTAAVRGLPIYSDVFYNHKNSKIDYGVICGAGFQLNAVLIELRAYMSIRNLYKKGTREMRSNSISLNLAYNFSWRKTVRYGKRPARKTLKYRLKHLFKRVLNKDRNDIQ